MESPGGVTIGNFAQRYLAAAASTSEGATAATITFFSSGLRSRCPALPSAAGLATPGLSAEGEDVAQAESAKLAANVLIRLNLLACKVYPFPSLKYAAAAVPEG
jgi:hypothetical protein